MSEEKSLEDKIDDFNLIVIDLENLDNINSEKDTQILLKP